MQEKRHLWVSTSTSICAVVGYVHWHLRFDSPCPLPHMCDVVFANHLVGQPAQAVHKSFLTEVGVKLEHLVASDN